MWRPHKRLRPRTPTKTLAHWLDLSADISKIFMHIALISMKIGLSLCALNLIRISNVMEGVLVTALENITVCIDFKEFSGQKPKFSQVFD